LLGLRSNPRYNAQYSGNLSSGKPGQIIACFWSFNSARHNFSGGGIYLTEHKCNGKNNLRRILDSGNWLELARIGEVSVAHWLELARTGWN
jgi:hypothetical protein